MPNSTALAIQVGTLYQPLVGLHHAQQLLNAHGHTCRYTLPNHYWAYTMPKTINWHLAISVGKKYQIYTQHSNTCRAGVGNLFE